MSATIYPCTAKQIRTHRINVLSSFLNSRQARTDNTLQAGWQDVLLSEIVLLKHTMEGPYSLSK